VARSPRQPGDSRAVFKQRLMMRSIPLRFGLANALIIASGAAIACGGWPIVLAIAAIYVMGGPVDEVVNDRGGHLAFARQWFCDANLYLTLPLILLLTFVYLQFAGGSSFELPIVRAAAGWSRPQGTWRYGMDLAAATLLVGTCYAMFGATVAHELTHRPAALAQQSARGLLALMWNTSFTIFHIHCHHRYVGTLRDPATARRNEHIFPFTIRTSIGQYAVAFRLEAARLRSIGRPPWSWRNRVLSGQIISLAIIAAAAIIAGWRGILALLAAALVGRAIHEFVNYIQHFGLVRVEGAPVAARHSWDCYRTLSNVLYYNLPRHSQHHLFASRPYWALGQAPCTPVLPHGYSTMVLLAMVPPLWRRVMSPRLADWDLQLASEAERALIAERGWDKLR
jgi:fatty acid desaturase